ncbi:MAG: ABC transporter ATP-binding protein [Chloroflexi bacterium]|nr:ABC transporter ATP-binding protein [Chloroflexota bacterium]
MITIDGLTAGYGKLEILQDLSLTFAEGQFSAVLGPNGSGKSTLMKAIMGLNTIFGGSIQLRDRELIGLRTEEIPRLGIAYVPQRENIFDELTVRENLQLGARVLPKAERPAALKELLDVFPILGRRGSQRAVTLSGGEHQMLAIAIAWLSKPTIMLLDEPSAGLAPAIASDVFRILQELREQGVGSVSAGQCLRDPTRPITLIVVEQNARRTLQFCDYAFVLREGMLVFEGTAEECLQDEETVKGYLGVHESARL